MELSSESPLLAYNLLLFDCHLLFCPCYAHERMHGSHTGADSLQPTGTNKATNTIHYNQILICSLEGNLFKRWLISSFDSILTEINWLVLHSNKKTWHNPLGRSSLAVDSQYFITDPLWFKWTTFPAKFHNATALWPAEMEASSSPTLILLSRLAMSLPLYLMKTLPKEPLILHL